VRRGGLRLRSTRIGIGLVIERLALQIRQLDHVAVDQAQASDPGPRQQLRHRRAKGADADDRDAGGAEALLALRTDRGEAGLAGMSFGVQRSAFGVHEGTFRVWSAEQPPEHRTPHVDPRTL
jgi:hypothetical protein